jgi:hypothetical protein
MALRLRCLCGKEAAISVRSIGKPTSCAGCRARFVVVWGIDPKTKSAVPITFDPSPSAPRGFNLPAGMFELGCPCGQKIYTRPRQTGKRLQCPVCSTWLKLEHDKDPQTLETRVRVMKSRLNQLPPLPPPPPAVVSMRCPCGESLQVETTENGGHAHCVACGRQLRLEMNEDSVSSIIVVAQRSADPAPPAEKRGFDEDLSLDDFR